MKQNEVATIAAKQVANSRVSLLVSAAITSSARAESRS
jgi:hypothetical protein